MIKKFLNDRLKALCAARKIKRRTEEVYLLRFSDEHGMNHLYVLTTTVGEAIIAEAKSPKDFHYVRDLKV